MAELSIPSRAAIDDGKEAIKAMVKILEDLEGHGVGSEPSTESVKSGVAKRELAENESDSRTRALEADLTAERER